MPQNFRNDIAEPKKFIITMELVPGRESTGRTVDTIISIAKDAKKDGRLSAVSITDNPGGNPSLSPDVLGHDIFHLGMDVIVHFTCRDMNRVGMESRALQLARMGMKNILALTGDYSGKGFGGQGEPVFDFDSVVLTCMLTELNKRLEASGDLNGFFTGCAVSPFKYTEAECYAQYNKLKLKVCSGASFIITQLGYDPGKYAEMKMVKEKFNINVPLLGSLYLLRPGASRAMNRGKVPGAYVPDGLYNEIQSEWENPQKGLKLSINRTAKLGVILKGLGYRGVHIGGVHRSFRTVAAILDRMDRIENSWEEYLNDFMPGNGKGFYMFKNTGGKKKPAGNRIKIQSPFGDKFHYKILRFNHNLFFNKKSFLASFLMKLSSFIDNREKSGLFKLIFEDIPKKLLLSCRDCGDCAIHHISYLCPESQCPKHMRNGACGGGSNGFCEVEKGRLCIWVRAYIRLSQNNESYSISESFIPPRMWELDKTSSWINFHLNKDHQGPSNDAIQNCIKCLNELL